MPCCREMAKKYNIKHFYDIVDRSDFRANPDYKGVCHIALAQEGHCLPGKLFMGPLFHRSLRVASRGKASHPAGSAGEVMFGTDSHTCNAGAFGQFASGVGNTDAGFILGTGKLLIKVPPTLRFVLDGQMPSYLMAKDLILHIIGEITVAGKLPLPFSSQLSVTPPVLLLTQYLPHWQGGPTRPWSSAAKPSIR